MDIVSKMKVGASRCKKRWQLFIFMVLLMAYIIIFKYYPMYGAQIAFRNFTPAAGITGSEWVGFEHFITFFKSFYFMRVLTNTLRISIYSLVAGYPLTLIFALMINTVRNSMFKKTVQTVMYIPHFISVVVLVGMIVQLLNPVTGLYGNLYRALIADRYPADILGKQGAFIHILIWSGVWQNLGWSTIIYVAALTSVNPELHEATVIDGANRLRRIIHIDFPAILPTASILLILNVGGIMNVGFEKVYLMQNNLNLVKSEIIATYVYKVGVTAGGANFSYASAIGLFNPVVNCMLLFITNKLSGRLNTDGGPLF